MWPTSTITDSTFAATMLYLTVQADGVDTCHIEILRQARPQSPKPELEPEVIDSDTDYDEEVTYISTATMMRMCQEKVRFRK